MELNADFTARARVFNRSNAWQSSPSAGVDRKMLDRIGDEVARATTIVRYAPNSHFPRHTHTGGEEFIVLDGVFQDEHGDFPAGSYIRNPPTSSHRPGSKPGCTIFVKLWQFDMEDRNSVKLHMDDIVSIDDVSRNGVSSGMLHKDDRETVVREIWQPDIEAMVDTNGGAEILILSGSVTENEEKFGVHDWLRLPDGYEGKLTAGLSGATLWVKYGNLRFATPPAI
ncbi:cupin domain-containing protein [Sphingorhabdus sp. EL138]|uniref:cupin domain-containing protein n=1 Tax=Sphingorhabdus sp. EL138 TaxID=2073156 RepID=UPI000D697EFD|nr:cupin domain-containing protein [Sphingorhabdus sp. EL138]